MTGTQPPAKVWQPTDDDLGVFDQAAQLRRLAERSRRAAPRPPVRLDVPARPAARRARVIAVTSGKGGVGKSNVSVNLAVQFARAGRRVVLLDADLGTANADVLCGMDLPRHLGHFVARAATLRQVTHDAPGGFKLVGGANGLARVADLDEAERGRILTALAELEREADVILIDTGAGIGQNVLSFTRFADHVLIVTTPEPTAITDAYAVAKVICRDRQRRGGDAGGDGQQLSVLVNQARTVAEARAVHARLSGVARQFLNVALLDAGHVFRDDAVPRSVRRRVPVALAEPGAPASVGLARLAQRLERGLARQAPAAGGFFGRLSGWWRKTA